MNDGDMASTIRPSTPANTPYRIPSVGAVLEPGMVMVRSGSMMAKEAKGALATVHGFERSCFGLSFSCAGTARGTRRGESGVLEVVVDTEGIAHVAATLNLPSDPRT